MAIELRPGTNDAVIYNSVVTRNEYRLPPRLAHDSVVIDIGAHAGMFSHLALDRGARAVYAFEPEPANFEQAQRNLDAFKSRVTLTRRAVWRSDVPPAPLHFCPSGDTANAGGGTVIWETDGPVVPDPYLCGYEWASALPKPEAGCPAPAEATPEATAE